MSIPFDPTIQGARSIPSGQEVSHGGEDDEAILRAVRDYTSKRARVNRGAVLTLAAVSFIMGASMREMTGAVARDRLPFYLQDAYRTRCGILKSSDGTLLEDIPYPIGPIWRETYRRR